MDLKPKHHQGYGFFMLIALVIVVTLSIGSTVLSIEVKHNNTRIATLERQHNEQEIALIAVLRKADANSAHDIQLIRQADYRLCIRGQVTRAVININDKREHNQIVLPLYDCIPDKLGLPEIRLNAQQTKAFEHYVATSKHLP